MKATFFPRGGTHYKDRKSGQRCLWRELTFILHFIIIAVNPHVSFTTIIENWNSISNDLSNPLRKRKSQFEKYCLS